MAQVVVTLRAYSDIEDVIALLGDNGGRPIAVKYSSLFDALFTRLSTYPEICSARPALGRNVRICVVWPYVIIYKYATHEGTVAILRVVDGRRRITRRLLS